MCSSDLTIAAVQRRMGELGGVTTMLPTEDAIWVADELTRRFGLPKWTFSLTATDANRWVLRTCRQLTGRSKVLIMSYCYHGSVDETIIALEGGVRNVGDAEQVRPGYRFLVRLDLALEIRVVLVPEGPGRARRHGCPNTGEG